MIQSSAMANTSLYLLLLIACGAMLSIVPSAAMPTDEEFIEDMEMDDQHLGKVHDSREVDTHCRYEKNTNTLTDGSTNTLFDDYENGESVVLSSNATDKCYVRKIDDKELKQTHDCREGSVARNDNDPDHEEEDYEEGELLTQEEREKLSPKLQVICESKDIYWLVPAGAGSDVADTAARKKRSVTWCVRLYTRYVCYRRCRYWICRYYCYRFRILRWYLC